MLIKKSNTPYFLDIKKEVWKFLSKLNNKIQERCIKEINKLAITPIPKRKEHVLDIKNHKMLCELAVDKIRFYYQIEQEKITIDKVEYLGKVIVEHGKNNHKSGNKQNNPNQQFINWIKKLFKNNK